MLVYSGDWAELGEPTAGTPTEWTDLAGEYGPGDVDVGVEPIIISSSPVSAVVAQNKSLKCSEIFAILKIIVRNRILLYYIVREK